VAGSRKRQPGRSQQGKRGRHTTVPPAPNAIPLTFSSGHRGYLKPLSYQTFRRLREREEELFPEPEMPLKTLETDSGPVTTPAPQDTAEGLAYLVTLNTVAAQRAAYRLDFILDHFLTIEGAEDDAGKQALVEAHAADLAALADLEGQEITGDPWPVVLRYCILLSSQDYAMLQENALALCAPVTEREVAERVKSFRNLLAGATPDGVRQPPGAEGPDGAAVRDGVPGATGGA